MDDEKQSLALLKSWDKQYTANSVAASIFETWYRVLNNYIWHDKFGKPDIFMRSPSRDRTVQMLLNDEQSPWYFNNLSPKEESRTDIVNLSFKKALQHLRENQGDEKQDWQWGKVKQSHVPHLASIKGLGSRNLYMGGSQHTVNAMSEANGPSWKMVVSLGEQPIAYGILPGGSSGNPGSKHYDNQLENWEQGKLIPLLFLNSSQANENILYTTYLKVQTSSK
jgi:penicillin amidase